jgi:hypothetical protein
MSRLFSPHHLNAITTPTTGPLPAGKHASVAEAAITRAATGRLELTPTVSAPAAVSNSGRLSGEEDG